MVSRHVYARFKHSQTGNYLYRLPSSDLIRPLQRTVQVPSAPAEHTVHAPRSTNRIQAREVGTSILLFADSSAKLTQPGQRHDQYITWVEFGSGAREAVGSGQILSSERLI